MATGACGIDCGVCGLRVEGKCSTCGPGTSEEASRKVAAQARLLGSPCPILECARRRKLGHCMRDCSEFPCSLFHKGPYPYSSAFLVMQERRRQTPMAEPPTSRNSRVVDDVHWRQLAELDPKEVETRCRCIWDALKGYRIEFLGEGYWVNPASRTVTPESAQALLEANLPLVLVIFLLTARDIPLEGQMVNERQIPGGELFFRHLHALPSHAIEEVFGSRPEHFMKVALKLGGAPTGDCGFSVEFRPLPRIPVWIHLWPEDEEFPARCTFTFDSSIHKHLPLDIVWALVQVLVQRIVQRARSSS